MEGGDAAMPLLFISAEEGRNVLVYQCIALIVQVDGTQAMLNISSYRIDSSGGGLVVVTPASVEGCCSHTASFLSVLRKEGAYHSTTILRQ